MLKRRVKAMRSLILVQLVAMAALLALVAVNMVLNRDGLRFSLFSNRSPDHAAQGQAPGPADSARPQPEDAAGTVSPAGTSGTETGGMADLPALSSPVSPALVIDPDLASYQSEFEQVAVLEAQDTIEALEEALSRCERILTEAGAAHGSTLADGSTRFPLLEARIDRLENRIDDLKLRRML